MELCLDQNGVNWLDHKEPIGSKMSASTRTLPGDREMGRTLIICKTRRGERFVRP